MKERFEITSGRDLEEARAEWEKSLESDPPEHDAWYGYAELCLFLDRDEEYSRARRELLKRFGATTNSFVAERTSRACLLMPATGDELRQAAALAERAIAAAGPQDKWAYAHFLFARGLAEYRQGDFKRAIPTMQGEASGVLGPAPRLVVAMALHRSGKLVEARKTLATAILAHDWRATQVHWHDDWICHSLRREAERLILPNLPAFLNGSYQPQDNDERFALLGACQFTNRNRAMAGLYVDAFAAAPPLADDLHAGHRYNAARAAALAGCGQGEDATGLGEEERKRWRKQACEWLGADLAMWTAKLDSDSPSERSLASRMLTNWQAEPDLAGLREPHALDDLSADERKDWLALWHDVRALLKRTGPNRVTSAFDPKRPESKGPSPLVLMRLARLDEARVAYQSALKADPPQHEAWHAYAELCLFLGEEDEYRRARRDLVERFGGTNDPYVAERAGRACLLMPATGDELQRFVAFAQRAIARNAGEQSAQPWFEFGYGLADYRQGNFDQAISAMRGDAATVLGPGPTLVIAMALHQKGQADEARKTLASSVLSYDWSSNQVRDVQGCILHSLRREAERLILPNLPAFLDGNYQPQDNDERLALLGVCQFTNRTRAMARLYADAFDAGPSLADNLVAGHRYSAARAAALAGCGHGADAKGLGEEERAQWREQARQWLRADLAARSSALNAASPATRAANRKALNRWRNEPDLACLRLADELNKLPAGERKDCLALWDEVAALLARPEK
jgi:tetratricopeptide (TPR) repeat protein